MLMSIYLHRNSEKLYVGLGRAESFLKRCDSSSISQPLALSEWTEAGA